MPSFDLVSHEWIPVLDAGTDLRATSHAPLTLREVGLRDALVRAHEIREVYTDSPLETIALYRLLLALALDVYQPTPDVDRWIALWRAGRFPAEPLDAYLSDAHRGHQRFDLLHPDRPWYQSPIPDASQEGKAPAPLAKLFHAQASGNNATLFGHDLDTRPDRLPLALAARGLVATQSAALGGGVSQPFNFSHAPLVGRAQFWLRGRSLFEALLFNGPPDEKARMGATERDAPVWRRSLPKAYARRIHQGLLDVLTWPSRRLTLVTETQDGETVATGVYPTQGDKLDPQPANDPLAAHVAKKQEGTFPLGFRASRALWRDFSTLFRVADPGEAGAPFTFRWATELVKLVAPEEASELRLAFREHGIDAFGLTTKEGKAGVVEFWRHERLPLHIEILKDEARMVALGNALESAEDGWSGTSKWPGLRAAIRTTAEYALAPPAPGDDGYPNADPKAVSALARSLGASPRYWALVEPSFFEFLRDLAAAATDAARAYALASWRRAVSAAALVAFDAATSSFDHDARHLRARTEGRARLARSDEETGSPEAPTSLPASAPEPDPEPVPQLDFFAS